MVATTCTALELIDHLKVRFGVTTLEARHVLHDVIMKFKCLELWFYDPYYRLDAAVVAYVVANFHVLHGDRVLRGAKL